MTLGTSDTRSKSRVSYTEKSDSEDSKDSTATLASRLPDLPGPSTRPACRINKSKYRTVVTDKYAKLKKRLMMFKGTKDPLHGSMIRLIDIVVKIEDRLTKTEMRNVMKPLKLKYEDQEHVLNKVYPKYNKICNEIGI